MARKQTTPKPLIQAASIATVLEKHTNKILGFLVKSNRTEDYYQIQTGIIGGERVFFCDCEAKDWGCSECCHIKAIKEVLVAKAELENQEAEAALQAAATFEALKARFATPVEAEQGETPAQVAQAAMIEAAEKQISQIAKPLPYINTSKYAVSTPNYRPHEEACTCGADGWQQHYKREFEAFKAEQERREKQLNSPANAGFSLLKPAS